MDKKYKTSVRRAANLLVQMDHAKDYTTNWAEDDIIDMEIAEVIQWLVDRDKRQRDCIAALKIERYRNATVLR